MLSFTQKQLFNLITSTDGWNKGYCSNTAAAVLKFRHKEGTLSQKAYDKLFFHLGYKKELIWTKN